MPIVEIINLATQGGALVLLVLVGYGTYRVGRDVVPPIKDFLLALVAQIAAIGTRVAVIEAMSTHHAAAVAGRIAEASGALGKVGDAVAAEALEVRLEVQAAERRLTSAIRREQASDPPPSRTSSVTHPTTQRPAVSP